MIILISAEFVNVYCSVDYLHIQRRSYVSFMMTSWNENNFRVTGPLCGEFTGHRWIPSQRPVTQSLDFFFRLRLNHQFSKQWRRRSFATSYHTLLRHCNVIVSYQASGSHSTNDFSIVIQIRWKFHSTLIHAVIKWSLYNLVHGTVAMCKFV